MQTWAHEMTMLLEQLERRLGVKSSGHVSREDRWQHALNMVGTLAQAATPTAPTTSRSGAATPQPQPTRGERSSQSVAEYLKQLIDERTRLGIAKYGTPLMTHNGRDALMDALQEALDLNQYLAQALLEARDRQVNHLFQYSFESGVDQNVNTSAQVQTDVSGAAPESQVNPREPFVVVQGGIMSLLDDEDYVLPIQEDDEVIDNAQWAAAWLNEQVQAALLEAAGEPAESEGDMAPPAPVAADAQRTPQAGYWFSVRYYDGHALQVVARGSDEARARAQRLHAGPIASLIMHTKGGVSTP